ncbi:hypothetical protein [Microbacterium sp. No. 7]|uniref:hypothetical protein n=1 Tax=Microbacterium sp. No. 7 TaxID=1714373 RepID=UPI0006ED3E30|nr:hypothetical protein [Microbacterium sp. No. 7]ALJ18684.1 hypothetical protein AOA12_01640 [Microbacterium sp. No. 7]
MARAVPSRGRKALAVIAVVVLGGMLVACASGDPAPAAQVPDAEASPVSGYDGPVPEFSGPWADEFASSYRKSTSDFERAALEDGEISDAEYVELQERFRTCLAEGNIAFTEFNPDGSFQYQLLGGTSPDEGNEVVTACAVSSGQRTLGFLYVEAHRNPQKLVEAELIAACLVEQGAVEKGYTADDYMRGSFPFVDEEKGEELLDYCSADPLGLLGMKASDFAE